MSDINDVQLRRLDSGLLLVFEAVMQTRKLTLVAERLGLTQPAISHALGRLRDIFGDPLFLRRQQGVEPTPRALLLAPAMAQALAGMRNVLREAQGFDLARAQRVVQIIALDAAIGVFAPRLLPLLAQEAPGIKLAFRGAGRAESVKALASGTADMALGVYDPLPPGMVLQPIRRETFAVLARAGHPAFAEGMTLEGWLEQDQLVVSAAGDLVGAADAVLAARGLKRRVVAAIPTFFAALAIVGETDATVAVPRSLAEGYAAAFGLQEFEPPLPLPGFEVALIRPELPAPDPVIDWLCGRIAEINPGARHPAPIARTRGKS